MSYPRVIIYAHPDDFICATRAAKRCLADGYEWPADGIAMVSFYAEGQEPWQGDNFSIRRNKGGLTVYGPSRTAPIAECAA
jgi:hypothetical protein